MSWWSVNLNNPNYERKAGAVTSTPVEFKHTFRQAQPQNDKFGQYDRPLEHGYAGEQYKYGKKAGGLLNFEC